MKTEFYKKVYIKSESDLPKEEGEYTISILDSDTPTGGATFNFLKTNIKWWLNNIHWYFLPLENELKTEQCHNIYGKVKEANTSDKRTFEQAEDFPDIDFKESIANELSRDQLIERICEMNKSYKEMREEWFKVVMLKEQPEITEEEIDKWAFSRVENVAQESLFDRGYMTGLKHGAIAMRDNKIK